MENTNTEIKLLQEINQKISLQRNGAFNRIAELEIIIDKQKKEINQLRAQKEGQKLFDKENNKDKK